MEIEDGVNQHGLAIGLTSVHPRSCRPGLNAGLLLRYLLEKCRTVSEAISCLHRLPIASAQTLILADRAGKTALVECSGEGIETTASLSRDRSFVCSVNRFYLGKMADCNCDRIDDWFAEERHQTLMSAFGHHRNYNLTFARKLLSGDYGFLCQYDRNTGKDTVWSVIYDLKRRKIYRSEGNPKRCSFREDSRFHF